MSSLVEEDPADLDDEYRWSKHCSQNIYFCYQPSTPSCHCWRHSRHCRHLRGYFTEAPNITNIDEVIKQAAANDGELQDINLNNIKYISDQKWSALFSALRDNSVVESLSAANCDLTDSIVKGLCDFLDVSQFCVYEAFLNSLFVFSPTKSSEPSTWNLTQSLQKWSWLSSSPPSIPRAWKSWELPARSQDSTWGLL